MNRVRWILVPVLFVAIALFNIGGCGGGGGGGDNRCRLPALNTDFSDKVYTFEDLSVGAVIDVSSNGDLFAMVITNIPFDGNLLLLESIPIGADDCVIFASEFNGIPLTGSGFCFRASGGKVLVINDLVSGGVPLQDIFSDCVDVNPLVVNASLKSVARDRAIERSKGLERSSDQDEKILGSELRELVSP